MHTWSRNLRDVRQFESYLQSVDIEDVLAVHKETVQEYMNRMLSKGKSAATVTRSVASLKSFYHYLVLVGVLKKSPVQDVVPVKVERHLPQILTGKEVELSAS